MGGFGCNSERVGNRNFAVVYLVGRRFVVGSCFEGGKWLVGDSEHMLGLAVGHSLSGFAGLVDTVGLAVGYLGAEFRTRLGCCSCELGLCWAVARRLVGVRVGCNPAVGWGNRLLVGGIGLPVAGLAVDTDRGIGYAEDNHVGGTVVRLGAVACPACFGSLVVADGLDSCFVVVQDRLGPGSYLAAEEVHSLVA